MVDTNALAGAFGSVVEQRATVEARSASSRALGSFGLSEDLNPFAPKPTAAPLPIGNTANVAKEDQQAAPSHPFMQWVKQYQRLLLIVGGVVLVVSLVAKRRGKK